MQEFNKQNDYKVLIKQPLCITSRFTSVLFSGNSAYFHFYFTSMRMEFNSMYFRIFLQQNTVWNAGNNNYHCIVTTQWWAADWKYATPREISPNYKASVYGTASLEFLIMFYCLNDFYILIDLITLITKSSLMQEIKISWFQFGNTS